MEHGLQHDNLADGRTIRLVTLVDQLSRQRPVLEVGTHLTGADIATALDRAIGAGTVPASITLDHGTEIMSRAREDPGYRRQVQLDFTRPGKPTDNGHIESLNGELRDERLNLTQFESLTHAQAVIEALRCDHNAHRAHGALGYLTPRAFAD